MISPALLRAFLLVYEQRSVTQAAQQLHLTQPAITKRIHKLEQALSNPLFDVIGRKLVPTEAAHLLYPLAKQWLNDIEQIQQTLSTAQQGIQGRLNLGVSHYLGLHYLPVPLRHFVQTYPQVELQVQFVDSESAHQAVQLGQLDLALVTLPPEPDPQLSYEPLWQEELVFIVAPFHPLAQQPNLTLADLLAYPALLPDTNTFTTQLTLKLFEQHQLRARLQHHTNALDALAALVSIGLGWSVLPKPLLNPDLQQIYPALATELYRTLGMVWHPGRSLSRAAIVLRETLISRSQIAKELV